jgi:hypothetical protein
MAVTTPSAYTYMVLSKGYYQSTSIELTQLLVSSFRTESSNINEIRRKSETML